MLSNFHNQSQTCMEKKASCQLIHLLETSVLFFDLPMPYPDLGDVGGEGAGGRGTEPVPAAGICESPAGNCSGKCCQAYICRAALAGACNSPGQSEHAHALTSCQPLSVSPTTLPCKFVVLHWMQCDASDKGHSLSMLHGMKSSASQALQDTWGSQQDYAVDDTCTKNFSTEAAAAAAAAASSPGIQGSACLQAGECLKLLEYTGFLPQALQLQLCRSNPNAVSSSSINRISVAQGLETVRCR